MQRIKAALALLLCLALASPAQAAIALVTSGSSQNAGTVTVTLNTTGSTLLTACVSSDGASDGAAVVQDGSNAWIRIAQGATGGGNHVSMWYSLPISVSAGQNITFNGSFNSLMVQAYSGTAASSVLDGAATTNSGVSLSTIQPGSITPAANGSLLSTCIAMGAGTSQETIGSGFTKSSDVSQSGSAYAGSFAYLIQPTAAAINPTWGGTDWAGANAAYVVMQAFKPAGGGGGPAAKFPLSAVTP